MADEERNDDAPEQAPPEEEAPASEEHAPAPEEQAPAPEEQAPASEEEAPAPREEAPASEEPSPEEPQDSEEPSQEPSAEDPPAAEELPAEQQAEAQVEAEPAAEQARGSDSPAGGEKPADVVPGAELEPIALEPERELDAEERARLEAEEEERARLEAEAAAQGDEPVARSGRKVELPADARIQATGKRKSAVARVVMTRGGGSIEVNRRQLDEYFPRENLRTMVRQPLLAAGYENEVDIRVRVHGGGISGQAGAVRHGIARALTEIEPELRPELKRRGLLTRDARAKERRKAGLKKARKRPQFSKR